jgi:hypothetical protein
VQALCPFEHVQALQPYCFVLPAEPDNVVTVLSSDTKEALELLSLSPIMEAMPRNLIKLWCW